MNYHTLTAIASITRCEKYRFLLAYPKNRGDVYCILTLVLSKRFLPALSCRLIRRCDESLCALRSAPTCI